MVHIAIVEDEALYVQQLKDFIQRYQKEQGKQIKVTVFPDGEDIIENYQGEFDIIFMDIQMKLNLRIWKRRRLPRQIRNWRNHTFLNII